jgi:hypothetical protein
MLHGDQQRQSNVSLEGSLWSSPTIRGRSFARTPRRWISSTPRRGRVLLAAVPRIVLHVGETPTHFLVYDSVFAAWH